MDLGSWMADGRWHALWELVTQLPGASRFRAAMLNDPEMVDLLLSHDDDGSPAKSWAPPVEDYTTTTKLLSMAVDGIHELLSAMVKLQTGKSLNIKPVPSPRTMLDDERERRDVDAAIGVAVLFGFSPEDFQ